LSITSEPVLTVVVVAHARRGFIAEALRSIEHQTLPRAQFEVFLLKDFEAPEIDPALARLGVTVVDLPPGPLGAWVEQAGHRFRGELVAFLDDDDRFEPEKLERVLEDFRSYPTAIYLHHAIRPLTVPGRESPSATNRTLSRGLRPTRIVPSEEWRRNFRALWQSGAAFNLSSIVVRSQMLHPVPDRLGQIQVSLSAYLFFTALRRNGTFLLDGRALTDYRRAEGFEPGGVPTPRAARRLSALARPRGADSEVLLGLVAPLQFPACEAPLRAARAQAELVEALEGAECGRGRALSDLLTAFRFRSWGALVAERVLFRDAFLFVVVPQWGRRSWERHCRVHPS
jgi:hypothetical protein